MKPLERERAAAMKAEKVEDKYLQPVDKEVLQNLTEAQFQRL